MRKKIVVLSGAGISAESGLETFRGDMGLWEGHEIDKVASIKAWQENPELVREFYNQRRRNVIEAKPNEAHLALVRLENKYQVNIITQNVDDLHERAGSKEVIHMHGLITKSQSQLDPNLIYPIRGWEQKSSDVCEYGMPLRPHIVFFGEPVPNMDIVEPIFKGADVMIVVGTTLKVGPVGNLPDLATSLSIKYVVDPNPPYVRGGSTVFKYKTTATEGIPLIVEELLAKDW